MSAWGELLIAIVMAVGITGIIVPWLPGLVLVWLSGLVWAWLDGGGSTRWTVFAVMTMFFAVGSWASFILPASQTRNAPPKTLTVASLLGIAGFFLIPVIGGPIGFAAGVYLMNIVGGATTPQAYRMTVATVKAFGWVVAAQLACASAIAVTWIVGLLRT
jgi:uncharacterized protein YqgC (DUF456 family)